MCEIFSPCVAMVVHIWIDIDLDIQRKKIAHYSIVKRYQCTKNLSWEWKNAFKYNIVIYQYNAIKERSSFLVYSFFPAPPPKCADRKWVCCRRRCRPSVMPLPPVSYQNLDIALFVKMLSIFIRSTVDNTLDGNTWNSLNFISFQVLENAWHSCF